MRKILILGLVAALSVGKPMIPFPIEEGALNRMVDLQLKPAAEAVQVADGRRLYAEKFHVKLEAKSQQIPIRRISWSLRSLSEMKREGQEPGEGLEIRKGELEHFDREESEEGAAYRGNSEIEIEGAGEEDRVDLTAEIELITGQKIHKREEYELDFRGPDLAAKLQGERKAIYAEPVAFKLFARDANLSEKGLEVTLDGQPLSVEWKRRGQQIEGKIWVREDGSHQLKLTGQDQAGHVSQLASETFTIDQTKPTFQLEGLSEGSHRGSVSGRIRVADAHPDPKALRLQLIRQTREGRSDLSGEVQQTSEGDLFFSEHIFSEDGRYSINISTRDAAGNRSHLSRSLLVNRRGSVFHTEGAGMPLSDQTLRQLPEFVLREENLNAMATGFPKLLLRQDGISRLLRSEDYQMESMQDAKGFWSHIYRIPRKLFETDGRYEMQILTRDLAGNQSRFGEEGELRFRMDRTKPVIHAISMKDGLRVDSDRYTEEFVIRDNQALREVRCFLDGREISLRAEGNRYYLDLDQGNYEEIRLEAEDAAGNRSEKIFRGIRVEKKNILERLRDLAGKEKRREDKEVGRPADDRTGDKRETANPDRLASAGNKKSKKQDVLGTQGPQVKEGQKQLLQTEANLVQGLALGVLLAGGLIFGILIRRARHKR